jgi:hypothetical protein
MRPKGISKFVASLAVCGFMLVGMSVASAAPGDLSKPIGNAGPIKTKEAFLASLDKMDGYCESTCCYAWFANCSGGSVSCSNSGCSWSCSGVGGGSISCDATPENNENN